MESAWEFFGPFTEDSPEGRWARLTRRLGEIIVRIERECCEELLRIARERQLRNRRPRIVYYEY